MTNLEQRVMAGVAVVWAARKLLSATALKLYVLLLSIGGIATFVSVSNVVHNFMHVLQNGPWGVAVFAEAAVLGTSVVVQLALIAAIAAFISLVAPALRTFSPRRFA